MIYDDSSFKFSKQPYASDMRFNLLRMIYDLDVGHVHVPAISILPYRKYYIYISR